LSANGHVRAITDGRFKISGPIYTGEVWAMGRTAVLEAESFTAVVTERPMEPLDLGVFESAGVNPRQFDFLILKSRMYCRPSFVPLSSALVECDSGGVTSRTAGSSVSKFGVRSSARSAVLHAVALGNIAATTTEHDSQTKARGWVSSYRAQVATEAALAFYGRLFGFDWGQSDSDAFIDLGDQFIALPKGRKRRPDDGRHFGLVVATRRRCARRSQPASRRPRPFSISRSRETPDQTVGYASIQFPRRRIKRDGRARRI
jgi:hypothetical protein